MTKLSHELGKAFRSCVPYIKSERSDEDEDDCYQISTEPQKVIAEPVKLVCVQRLEVEHRLDCASGDQCHVTSPPRSTSGTAARITSPVNAGLKPQQLEEAEHVDVWGGQGKRVDVQVSPEHLSAVISLLQAHHLPWHTRITDVQSLIDEQSMPSPRGRVARSVNCDNSTACEQDHSAAADTSGHILHYPSLQAIYEWMEGLQAAYPGLVEVIEIGRTYEHRTLTLIKVGAASGTEKKKIWIDAGMHAREWVSITTAIYCVNQLVAGYGSDAAVTELLEGYDWYFLVVANPDGYQYTRDRNRMWRKNRAVTDVAGHERCVGVDINRNFPYKWKAHCVKPGLPFCNSAHPCSGTFAGVSEGSELETQAITGFLRGERGFVLSLSLHAYSQLWLLPWSHTHHTPDDYDELKAIARLGAKAIYEAGSSTRFYVGIPYKFLYKTGGSSMDWAKAEAGIKYSYSLELRDKGRFGYLMPERYIEQIGRETWLGVQAVAEGVARALNASHVNH